MSNDCCGLSGISYSGTYNNVQLFLALMGMGAIRSLHILTAHDRSSHQLLFDIRIESTLDALLTRGRRVGASVDEQLRATAFDYARRIIDAGVNGRPAHYRLEVGTDAETLAPPIAVVTTGVQS